MDFAMLPIAGQYGILGLSLGLNVFFLVQWVRGVIVSHKLVEQANATTAQVQSIADTMQKAWETEMARGDKMGETLNKILVQGETTLRILEARPPILHRPGEVDTRDVV